MHALSIGHRPKERFSRKLHARFCSALPGTTGTARSKPPGLQGLLTTCVGMRRRARRFSSCAGASGGLSKRDTTDKESLNDAGQIAFYYELADGRAGIARADPLLIPELGAKDAVFVSLKGSKGFRVIFPDGRSVITPPNPPGHVTWVPGIRAMHKKIAPANEEHRVVTRV
jgi:hypothetical protein